MKLRRKAVEKRDASSIVQSKQKTLSPLSSPAAVKSTGNNRGRPNSPIAINSNSAIMQVNCKFDSIFLTKNIEHF